MNTVLRNPSAKQKPRLIALLPESAVAELKSALGVDLGEVLCANSNALAGTTEKVDAVFVDPTTVESSSLSYAVELLKEDVVPCVGFVELDARNLYSVLSLASPVLTTCFVYPLGRSESDRLRHFVLTLPARKLTTRFLTAFEPSIGRLPPSLLEAILNLFERPWRYDCASDLALQARVARRSLYRNFDAVRVGSPRKLVIVARIIHAYAYLRQQVLTVHDVAAKVGYEKVETLVQHCDDILGCFPSALRAEPAEDEVLRHLLEWYCKPEMSTMVGVF